MFFFLIQFHIIYLPTVGHSVGQYRVHGGKTVPIVKGIVWCILIITIMGAILNDIIMTVDYYMYFSVNISHTVQ